MSSGMTDTIMKDMRNWGAKVNDLTASVLREVQNEMLADVIAMSPYNEYETKETKKVGHMRIGWVKDEMKPKKHKKMFIVRSRNKPTVIHLVSFPHAHFSHRRATGTVTKEDSFIAAAQLKANEELQRRLDEKLNGGN
ncbi:MAG: hypothetical protein NC078_09905 [Ruminococcus sp.]|nr:hypothetical protein [Ruminococcus sp.]